MANGIDSTESDQRTARDAAPDPGEGLAESREPGVYPAGALVGSYRIEKLIGSGGTAIVYLAEHRRLGRRVALKCLRRKYAGNPEVIQRFFAEARAVNSIGHENIVEIVDLAEDPVTGNHYFVMELLDGLDLHCLLDLEGSLPARRAVAIAVQIADALAAAHEVGIVHRDVKPENVYLVDRGGRHDFVKVLDFGVAKIAARISGSATRATPAFRTMPGVMIGTPAYMSPEQIAGRPVDARTDIFNLGLIMYEMVTGAAAFEVAIVGEVVVAHMTSPPTRPSAVPGVTSAVPRDLEDLILECLESDPARRPPAMRGVEERLGAIAAGHGWLGDRLAPPPDAEAATPPAASPQDRVVAPDAAASRVVAVEEEAVGSRAAAPSGRRRLPRVALPVAIASLVSVAVALLGSGRCVEPDARAGAPGSGPEAPAAPRGRGGVTFEPALLRGEGRGEGRGAPRRATPLVANLPASRGGAPPEAGWAEHDGSSGAPRPDSEAAAALELAPTRGRAGGDDRADGGAAPAARARRPVARAAEPPRAAARDKSSNRPSAAAGGFGPRDRDGLVLHPYGR